MLSSMLSSSKIVFDANYKLRFSFFSATVTIFKCFIVLGLAFGVLIIRVSQLVIVLFQVWPLVVSVCIACFLYFEPAEALAHD